MKNCISHCDFNRKSNYLNSSLIISYNFNRKKYIQIHSINLSDENLLNYTL